jgi:5'-nucleotidase
MPPATLLNINVPGRDPEGVDITRLGKRIYRDSLALEEEGDDGRRLYRIYGDAPGYHHEEGTDLASVADGRIAVTPVHFDLTDRAGMDALRVHDLARLLRPAAREVE